MLMIITSSKEKNNMNHIKNIIMEVKTDRVLTIYPVSTSQTQSFSGQRIAIYKIDEKRLLIPQIAYVLGGAKYMDILIQNELELKPGQTLIASKPTGTGFTKLGNKNRVLINFENENSHFLSNYINYIAAYPKNEISVLVNKPNLYFPESVELITSNDFKDASSWAERIYYETSQTEFEETCEKFLGLLTIENSKKVELFVHARYGCAEVGECGLCSIKLLNKNLFLCQRGPVLKFSELINK